MSDDKQNLNFKFDNLESVDQDFVKADQISDIEQGLKDLKAGKIILVLDDPDRENEGDLICAAEFATTENIVFMVTEAKGLVCMPIAPELAEKLNFKPMCETDANSDEAAFAITIDHVDTTSGISAVERSITAMGVICDNAESSDFRRPGHMFPLIAKSGGVFERRGHTEATVDLMKLAGLKPCGLCCEMMANDGNMMGTNELLKFAKEHDITVITISDLVEYRKRYETANTN